MFVRGIRGVRGMRGMGEYVQRSPSDWKIDNWIGQPVGGGLQVAMAPASVIPNVSNTTAAAVGIGGLAAAAALAWYLFK